MKVLIACEESQAVCIEFRKLGHEAYSCDILPCSGGHPEWHIQDDVSKHLNDGWDLMIGHPPCTYLSNAGNGWFDISKYGENAIKRLKDRIDAVEFFMQIYNAPIKLKCIENPFGYMQTIGLKHDQIIQPYYFGDSDMKATCLWLVGLPKLTYSKTETLFYNLTAVEKPEPIYIDKISGKRRYFTDAISGNGKDGKKIRSKTFPGIAKAMAEQWGGKL